MPRLLAPRNGSFSKMSNPSLLGSKTSSNSFGSSVGVGSASSRQPSFGKSHGKGSQFSLTRRPSFQKQKSSTNSLRRQKSSRQNSLSSYAKQAEAEASKRNDEWDFTQEPSKRNALWNIVNQGSVSQGPPSLAGSVTSAFTEHSSQASLPPSGSHSPPTSVHSHAYDAKDDLLRRIALHQKSMRNPTNVPVVSPGDSASGGEAPQRPTILHATNSLQRSRRNSFIPPSQIKEEDAWGHFVESDDAELHGNLLSATRRYPASFSHSSAARAR